MTNLKVFFAGDEGWMHNLGDALVPPLLAALGFRCVTRAWPDAAVLNPGRCLLVIGSLVTNADLRSIDTPIDVWGCGWKGAEAWEGLDADVTFHAVRGPLTAEGVRPGMGLALGDPALLLPHLLPRPRQPHGATLLMPHVDRVASARAQARARAAGCDEARSTFVYAAPTPDTLRRMRAGMALYDLRRWFGLRTTGVHPLWASVDRIAGAAFVLTGSLHGAILAQAFGVPWAAFTDGSVDSPSKWRDWGAYLGVPIAFTRTLAEGRTWWQDQGRAGRIRDLAPLVRAFPYFEHSARAQRLFADLRRAASASSPDTGRARA